VLIHDGELILRSTIADDPELKKLQEDARILKHMSETRMYPFAMPSQMSFRIESEGKVIGEVSLKTIRWFNRKAEISIFIVPEYQGKGYGKRALKKIMELAFGTFNLYRLEAEVMEFNEPSIRLMESLGFKLEGRLREARYVDGKYWDILRYGILRREFEG